MARPQTTPQDLSIKLNTLESAIVNAEAAAEDARWQQASIVAQLLDAGQTQRQIAADWYNFETGKPYGKSHVQFVEKVWKRFGQVTGQDRPDWTTAYYTVQKGSDELIEPEQRRREWSDAHEARAPKSQETAEKLVQNLLKEKPGIAKTVHQGLEEGLDNRYVPPVERERRRKEADAFAKNIGEPIRNGFGKLNVVLALEEALDELREMTELDTEAHGRILDLLRELEQEAGIKRTMSGVR